MVARSGMAEAVQPPLIPPFEADLMIGLSDCCRETSLTTYMLRDRQYIAGLTERNVYGLADPGHVAMIGQA